MEASAAIAKIGPIQRRAKEILGEYGASLDVISKALAGEKLSGRDFEIYKLAFRTIANLMLPGAGEAFVWIADQFKGYGVATLTYYGIPAARYCPQDFEKWRKSHSKPASAREYWKIQRDNCEAYRPDQARLRFERGDLEGARMIARAISTQGGARMLGYQVREGDDAIGSIRVKDLPLWLPVDFVDQDLALVLALGYEGGLRTEEEWAAVAMSDPIWAVQSRPLDEERRGDLQDYTDAVMIVAAAREISGIKPGAFAPAIALSKEQRFSAPSKIGTIARRLLTAIREYEEKKKKRSRGLIVGIVASALAIGAAATIITGALALRALAKKKRW